MRLLLILMILIALAPAYAAVGTQAGLGVMDTNNAATCTTDANVTFGPTSGSFRFNLTDDPQFRIQYNMDIPALGTTYRYYVTSSVIWDDESLSGQWSTSNGYRVPNSGKFYAYNRSVVTLTSASSSSGTISLGSLSGSGWTKAAGVTGLNHTGPFKLNVNIRVTTDAGVGEIESWYGDSEESDSNFPGAACARDTSNSKKGWIMTNSNVTLFDTYHNASYSNIANNEDDKFMRGEPVFFHLKLDGKTFSGTSYKYYVNISNSTGQTVQTQTLTGGETGYTFSWTVPDNVATKDYNVSLFVNQSSAVTGETWTHLYTSRNIQITQDAMRINTTLMSDPLGEVPNRNAAFWVEKDLGVSVNNINVTYVNRGEAVLVNMTVKDAWDVPLDTTNISIRMNSSTTKFNLTSAFTNANGIYTPVVVIPLNANDTYYSASPNNTESKNYSLNVHMSPLQSNQSLGSYGHVLNQIDVDSQYYFRNHSMAFQNLMRGDTQQVNATFMNVRNETVRSGTTVTFRFFNPDDVATYSSNAVTTGGLTSNYNRLLSNSDVSGDWSIKYSVDGEQASNFNNSISETTMNSFILNKTITAFNISINILGETSSLKVFNLGEVILINGTLNHSDGGTYRTKSPSGSSDRIIRVQIFNNTYGTNNIENTTVTVDKSTGNFNAIISLNSSLNDTYASTNYSRTEALNYDIRFYDGGTPSSSASGNDANATDLFDIDSNLYHDISANGRENNDHYRPGNTSNFTITVKGARGQLYSNLYFGSWWNFSWQHKKNITITNSNTNSLASYPVRIEVDTSALVAAGKLNSDISDLRFIDSDDATNLDYWIEVGANTPNTVIWVEIPSISASSSKTIYMYYKNSAALAKSDGAATFSYFNNFSSDPQLADVSTCTLQSANTFVKWDSANKRINYSLRYDDCAADSFAREFSLGSSFNNVALHYRLNQTAQGDEAVGEARPVMMVRAKNSTSWYGGHHRVRSDTPDMTFGGQKENSDLTNNKRETSTSYQSSGSTHEGSIDVRIKSASDLVAEMFNKTGHSKTTGTATGTPNVQSLSVNKIEFRRPAEGALAGNTKFSHGWIDDLFLRKYSDPEPSAALVNIEYDSNQFRNLTFNLTNNESSVLHTHQFFITDGSAKYNDTDFTFPSSGICELWNATARIVYKNNTGTTITGFYLSSSSSQTCDTGSVPANVSIRNIITMDTNRVRYIGFLERDSMIISANVTHGSGASVIGTVLLNLTAPNQSRMIENANMINITNITLGYVFDFNYTIPVNSTGTWVINIYANSTDSGFTTSNHAFIVNVNREIAAIIVPSQPYTLQINGSRGTRSGRLPVTRG